MPIYEYACEKCGHEMEVLQKMADPPLQDCPECQQPALKKLISAVAFRLKGAGWYETDFKSGDKKNLVDDGKKADSGNSTGDKKESSDKSKAADKKDSKSSSSDSKSTDSKSTSSSSSTKQSSTHS